LKTKWSRLRVNTPLTLCFILLLAQALNSILEQEKPDYDLDGEDEKWVRESKKRVGVEITPDQFEEMIDRLEKSCGKQVSVLLVPWYIHFSVVFGF